VAPPVWTNQTRTLFGLLVVAWGLNYIFVNIGLGFAAPLWLATLRAAIGLLVSVPIVASFRGPRTLDRRGMRDAMLIGIPSTGFFLGLWFWAQRAVLPGVAAVVIYTYPLWVAVLAQPVLGHRLGPRHWAAVATGFVGVAFVSQLGLAGGAGISLPAILALLGAAIFWAVGTVLFQRRFRAGEMVEANAYQLLGGTVTLLAATLVLSPTPLPRPSAALLVSVLWLGVVGTAVAYAIWASLLERTRAAPLSAYLFLVPVVALGASVVLFGERLSWLQLLGIALVLASVYGVARAGGTTDPTRTPPSAPTRADGE
jgi:drug/metabolite transporter (DMT)-like permease